jgi:diguanylate cyclase (GGDEF)-like protein/PAS domain S-box-containing protein
MPTPQFLYVILSLVSSVFMLALGSYGLRERRNSPSATWFSLSCFSVFVWTSASAAETLAPTLAGKIFWSQVQYLGITSFPVFSLMFVSFFTQSLKKLDKFAPLLFVVPLVSLVMVWTNETHHWFWANVYIDTAKTTIHPVYQYGWYFKIHMVYSYALIATNFFLVLWGRVRSQRGQHQTFSVLLTAHLFPLLSSLGYLLGFVAFDLTPVSFALTSVLFAWALFRHDFIRQLPLPYHQVFYHLKEAVIVLDAKEKLLEFNDKARLYFQLLDSAIGHELALPFFTELKTSGVLEARFHNRVLALSLTPIVSDTTPTSNTTVRGYLLSAKDVTAQKQSEDMLEAQLEKLNALVITNDSLQQLQSHDQVYSEALGVVFEMTHADLASLLLYDEHTDSLHVVASQQRQPRQPTAFLGTTLKRGEGLSWEAFERARSVFLQDQHGLTSSHGTLDKATQEKATEWFGIPLLNAEGKPFGVLSVRIHSSDKTLSSSDKIFLEAIAQTCSNVLIRLGLLDNANAKASAYHDLYTSADRQARELTLLDRIRSSIAKELDPCFVIDKTIEAIYEVLGYTLCAICTLEGDKLVVKSQLGYDDVPSEVPLTTGIMAKAIRQKRAVFAPDVSLDPDYHAAFGGIESELALPLLAGGQVVGVLNIETKTGHVLDEADVRLMTGIAEQVSFALERAKLYEDLKLREERLSVLAENTRDIIAWHDTHGHFLYITPAITSGFGYTPEEVLGKKPSDFAHPDDVALLRGEMVPRLLRGETLDGNHYRVRHKDGNYLWVETFAQPLFDGEGNVTGYVASSRDITERKRLQEQMLEGALLYDTLTNLPNRALFTDRLKHASQRSSRGQHKFAVLFLDLDRFKVINDSLGHSAGDKLLVGIAERLRNCVRPQDTVARLGGDEFAILLEDMDEAGAHGIAERIQVSLKQPFDIAGREVQSTVSIGITLNQDIADPEQLLRNADVAMYHAKNNGRARYATFDSSMHEKIIETMQLEVELRNALEHGELRVHYQPIVNLKTGSITGAEALVRWYHPTKGILQPGSFIAIAEDTGLIQHIDAWVLQEACQQVKTWQMFFGQPLTISVNLSTKNFRLNDLAETVLAKLEDSKLSASSLKLEITESVFMDNLEAGLQHLHRLREAGVSLQIDDFGTGYSSLSYLHELPLDSLKIDRSFIWKLDGNKKHNNGEIIQTILTLARSLNLTVVAEGIETEAQLSRLETLGCDYGQGFYFAKPLSATDFETLLSTPHSFTKIPVLLGQ